MEPRRQTSRRAAVESVSTASVHCGYNLGSRLRRTTRHSPDGPDALLPTPIAGSRRRWQTHHGSQPLPVGQSGAEEYRPDFGNRVERQPAMRRPANDLAEAVRRGSSGPGGIHLLEGYGRFQRLLRLVGRSDDSVVTLLAEPLQRQSRVGADLLRLQTLAVGLRRL